MFITERVNGVDIKHMDTMLIVVEFVLCGVKQELGCGDKIPSVGVTNCVGHLYSSINNVVKNNVQKAFAAREDVKNILERVKGRGFRMNFHMCIVHRYAVNISKECLL